MVLQKFSTEFIFTQDCSEPSASAGARVSVFAEGGVEGASEPSASADTRVSAFAEGGVEGPRRVILLCGVRKLKNSKTYYRKCFASRGVGRAASRQRPSRPRTPS